MAAFCNIRKTTCMAYNRVSMLMYVTLCLLHHLSIQSDDQQNIVAKCGTMQFSLEGVYFSAMRRVFPIRKSYLNKQPASETFTYIYQALCSVKW